MSEFDSKAADWDKNALHLERAEVIARKIEAAIPIRQGMKAMEFGAGTGLLSLQLSDKFDQIKLIDSSGEMIKVCEQKIKEQDKGHMQAAKVDLEKEELAEQFDCIYSQMTLHHVEDTGKIFLKLFNLLDKPGYLAIADLYPEDGSFHGPGFTGHKGFDPALLAGQLEHSGFSGIKHELCYLQKMKEPDGSFKEYPVFLLTAEKKG